MSETPATPPAPPKDQGLRIMLIWVAVAFVVVVLMAMVGVQLTLWILDR